MVPFAPLYMGMEVTSFKSEENNALRSDEGENDVGVIAPSEVGGDDTRDKRNAA